uniref:Uncharacterized protein n=1 Tax=Ditylenchus dipsaci TaxID=166011 RepID=A0A915EDI8_9BILA
MKIRKAFASSKAAISNSEFLPELEEELMEVRLFSSHQRSCDQQSEEIFEDTYMELRRNGMFRQACEFRGRALHLILEKRRLEDQVIAEFNKAAINLSTEYEVMIENPQG